MSEADTGPSSSLYAAARKRRLHQILILALGLINLAVYANSFPCGFTLDSQKMILLDSRITAVSPGNLNLIFTQGYWYPIQASGLYRPFTTLSYLFNFAILGNGAHPAGYHLVNLALHWLNGILLYLLVCELAVEIGLAFGIAALWTVHPLLTESVTNIVGRADLLAGAAILGGLLCYIRATDSSRRTGKLRWILALAVLSAIGIFSKESVAVLPALMLAYDFTFRRKPDGVAYAAVIAPCLAWWRMRSLAVQPYVHPFVDNPLSDTGFWTAKFTAIKVIGKYLWRLFFPLTLSSDYSYNQIPLVSWKFNNWEDWQAVLAACACAVLLLAAVLSYRRNKPVFYALIFAALTFAPTSNLLVPIGSIMAERFMYLPAMGILACLVACLTVLSRRLRSPRVAPLAITILALCFGCRTVLRNLDWRTDQTLAATALAASPASFKSHLFMANVLPVPANLDQCLAEMERSLAILKDLPDDRSAAVAYTRAGQLYRFKGERFDATHDGAGAPWYRKARDILLRGVAIDRATDRRYREHRLRDGEPEARIPPGGSAAVYRELGLADLRLHEPGAAVEALDYGRQLSPGNLELYVLLADAYQGDAEREQRVITLLEGFLLRPGEPHLVERLMAEYSRMDTGGCRAFSLEPDNGRVHMNLNCPVVQREACTAAENLILRFRKSLQEQNVQFVRQQAIQNLGCPNLPGR